MMESGWSGRRTGLKVAVGFSVLVSILLAVRCETAFAAAHVVDSASVNRRQLSAVQLQQLRIIGTRDANVGFGVDISTLLAETDKTVAMSTTTGQDPSVGGAITADTSQLEAQCFVTHLWLTTGGSLRVISVAGELISPELQRARPWNTLCGLDAEEIANTLRDMGWGWAALSPVLCSEPVLSSFQSAPCAHLILHLTDMLEEDGISAPLCLDAVAAGVAKTLIVASRDRPLPSACVQRHRLRTVVFVFPAGPLPLPPAEQWAAHADGAHLVPLLLTATHQTASAGAGEAGDRAGPCPVLVLGPPVVAAGVSAQQYTLALHSRLLNWAAGTGASTVGASVEDALRTVQPGPDGVLRVADVVQAGAAQLLAGRYHAAAHCLLGAVSAAPLDPVALHNLGVALLHLHRPYAARAAFLGAVLLPQAADGASETRALAALADALSGAAVGAPESAVRALRHSGMAVARFASHLCTWFLRDPGNAEEANAWHVAAVSGLQLALAVDPHDFAANTMQRFLQQLAHMPALAADAALRANNPGRSKQAYATLVVGDAFVDAAVVLGLNIRLLDQERPMVALHFDLGPEAERRLAQAGWQLYAIPDPLVPAAGAHPRLASTFNKLYIWLLTGFERVLFLDCDLLLLESLEPVFAYPVPAAVAFGPLDPRFNSGLLLIEPSRAEFQRLLSALREDYANKTGSAYIDSDQELLNWYYRDRWYELPFTYNTRLRGLLARADMLQWPMRVRVFHFAGVNTKPWDRSRRQELTYFALLWWRLRDECVLRRLCPPTQF